MRKHWLKINGYWSEKTTAKAWKNIKEYLQEYPESKITVFNSETNFFHKFFCLECNQNYRELELDCNSGFDGSLIRLERKPANLELAQSFQFLYNIYTKKFREMEVISK